MSFATTVTAVIALSRVGPSLQMLDYEGGFDLLDRRRDDSRDVEVWTLRSLVFPSCWEGHEIRLVLCELRGRCPSYLGAYVVA